MRFKFVAVLALVTIVMSGCFSDNDQVVDAQPELSSALFDVYQAADFSISFPKGWKVKDEFTSNIGKATQVAFVSNIKELFFTPTVTVAKQNISEGVLPQDFGQTIIDQNARSLIDYEEMARDQVAISGDSVTFLVQFRGKRQPEDDLVEYFQMYFVGGDMGFVVTAAHDPNGDSLLTERLLETIRSFRLR